MFPVKFFICMDKPVTIEWPYPAQLPRTCASFETHINYSKLCGPPLSHHKLFGAWD